jgi:type IV pilus assembly protein PilA
MGGRRAGGRNGSFPATTSSGRGPFAEAYTGMQQRSRARRRGRGFSLIELLIVINITMILAGMAVPHLRGAVKSANERNAVANLRTYSTAQELVRFRYNPPAYAGDLDTLFQAGLIDEHLKAGARSGYLYRMESTAATYSFRATPQSPGTTGDRYFFVDHTGVVRMEESSEATENSTPL